MTSPWVHLAAMPDVTLEWSDDDKILGGRRARYFPESKVIVMDSRMRRLKARCSLAHELGHIVLGHETPCGVDFFDQRVELEADEFGARLLMSDLDVLADEVATTCGPGHAAHHLNVTLDLYEVRMTTLTDYERAYIDRHVRRLHESQGA